MAHGHHRGVVYPSLLLCFENCGELAAHKNSETLDNSLISLIISQTICLLYKLASKTHASLWEILWKS